MWLTQSFFAPRSPVWQCLRIRWHTSPFFWPTKVLMDMRRVKERHCYTMIYLYRSSVKSLLGLFPSRLWPSPVSFLRRRIHKTKELLLRSLLRASFSSKACVSVEVSVIRRQPLASLYVLYLLLLLLQSFVPEWCAFVHALSEVCSTLPSHLMKLKTCWTNIIHFDTCVVSWNL